MTITDLTNGARNADLADLARLLQAQHDAKYDVVVPASAIRALDGRILVKGTSYEARAGLGSDTPGTFRPTVIADGHLADKLGIPVRYLRKLRDERLALYDANINGWLHGTQRDGETGRIIDGDSRRFLARTFVDDTDNDGGVLRALLSDTFKPIDNLDVLTAALSGVRESGTEVEVISADLSEQRMVVKIAAPGLAVLAPKLLEGYRSPVSGWTLDGARRAAAREGKGYPAGEEPVVFAGFVISNSETGGGAFTITPRVVVRVCKNGLMMTQDALRSVHLGGKLGEGQIKWSDDTQRKNLELVTSMAKDAVTTFLDTDYVEMVVARLEEKAGVELVDPAKTIEVVSKALKFSEDTQRGVLDHFIRGGLTTAGGVMQAVTSYAQHESVSADLSYELEAQAIPAMELAASR